MIKGTSVNLSSQWTVGDLLGSGGYGRVYELAGGDEPAVAKFVPKAPGADRELLFIDLEDVRNVVPIIDSGEYQDAWVLVMPRAEKSLRQLLLDSGGVLDLDEVVAVLSDMATALVDLEGTVVHRDLKPENVLLLHGSWCLADFGISRYAEASTAPDTHKWAMSPPYAAPERWRSERASSAADVYALGVMGFEMLKGHPPFAASSVEDYRELHLHHNPPAVDGAPVALATLVDECLFKSPGTRPSPENLLARLKRQKVRPESGGLAALQAANQSQIRRQLDADRAQSVAATAAEQRDERIAAAKVLYERVGDALRDVIMDAAPAAKLTYDRNMGTARKLGWSIKLGDATITLTDCARRAALWGNWQSPAFTVDLWGTLGVRIPHTRHGYEGRSHSLWFGDIQEAGRFGWYETSFMFSGLSGKGSTEEPFSLDPGAEAAKAVWNGMAEYQLAWPFTKLEPGNLDEFIERWVSCFGIAASGRLGHPSTMPERTTQNSWRRS